MDKKIKYAFLGLILAFSVFIGYTKSNIDANQRNSAIKAVATELNSELLNDSNKYFGNIFDRDRLETFTDDLIASARESLEIPGVIVSVVSNGEVVFSKGYGWADYPNQIPVTANSTQFAVASISKVFTYTALMQLVESGQISLNDNVADILEFPELDKEFSPITVLQLMTHSAGFEDRYLGESAIDNSEGDMPLQEYIRSFKPARIWPNDQFIIYNNYSTSLAGAVIEKVSGETFSNYMQKHIFSPLGMNNSTFVDSPISSQGDKNRAVGHMMVEGKYHTERANYHQQGLYPAAGLKSTADDMAKFMLLHLSQESSVNTPVVSKKSLKTMHQVTKRNHPQVPGNAHGFWVREIEGYQSLTHGGNTKGFKSNLVMVPELKLGVFISTNSINGHRLTSNFAKRLIKSFYAPAENKAPTQLTKNLSAYIGLYLPLRRSHSTIERMAATPIFIAAQKESLSIYTGNAELKVIPQGSDVFEVEVTGEKIAFEIDDNGQAKIFREANVYERIGFFQNAANLLSAIQILMFIALIIFLLSIINWIRKHKQTHFETITILAASLWLGFYACLSVTIASFSGGITPKPFVHFPDNATIIGQWILMAIIVCLPLVLVKFLPYLK